MWRRFGKGEPTGEDFQQNLEKLQYLITRMVIQPRSLQRVAFLVSRGGCIKRQISHSKDGQHLEVEVSLGFRDSKTLCHSQKAQTRHTREGDTSWPQDVAETRQTDMQRHGTRNHIHRFSTTQLQVRWEDRKVDEEKGRLQLRKNYIHKENVVNTHMNLIYYERKQ